MSIFSEIYGVYFRIAARLLQKAEVDEQTVYDEIRREGFRDSVLFLPQKLIPQKDGSDWHLFSRQADGTLRSVLHHKPEPRVTLLQKRWLRAKLNDPRLALFLSDEALLQAALFDQRLQHFTICHCTSFLLVYLPTRR